MLRDPFFVEIPQDEDPEYRPPVVRDPDVLRQLADIESRDPDGDEWRTEAPSETDYAAHEAWAVATYGPEVWKRYSRGGWDPANDPDF